MSICPFLISYHHISNLSRNEFSLACLLFPYPSDEGRQGWRARANGLPGIPGISNGCIWGLPGEGRLLNGGVRQTTLVSTITQPVSVGAGIEH